MGLLELIAVVLIILWLVGSVAVPVGGQAVHLLLVLAVIIIVIRLLRGERI